jgi:hypothetical protein
MQNRSLSSDIDGDSMFDEFATLDALEWYTLSLLLHTF